MAELVNTGDVRSEREQIFKNFALILQKSDPKHVRFYTDSAGNEDRIYDETIREDTHKYKLSYAPVVNLGRFHASLSGDSQPLLITMASHQTRRDSPLCRYTPQIFAFLAKYFNFRRATETVVEYVRMDELGWYTFHAISDVVAHDHPLASDGDLDTVTSKLFAKLKSLEDETYEQQARVSYHEGGFGSGHTEYWRAKKTASRLLRQIQEVRHLRLVRGLSDSPVLRTTLSASSFKTGDTVLDGLLETARAKFLSDDAALRREALEKLWDAWERLKTLEPGRDKKDSTRALLDKVTSESNFRRTLEREANELTSIGNG
jgi:hypothetical protein